MTQGFFGVVGIGLPKLAVFSLKQLLLMVLVSHVQPTH